MLERLNEVIKRPRRVVRIFPNAASCRTTVRPWAETHEGWLEDHRYLNMAFPTGQKKERRAPPPSRSHPQLHDSKFTTTYTTGVVRIPGLWVMLRTVCKSS